MAVYQKNKFFDQDIVLCNNEYRDCEITRCRFIYDASGPMVISDCKMIDCSWFFDGAARDTLGFLSAIYNTDGDGDTKNMFDELFNDIKNGKIIGIVR
jgi:hypothetical protein